MFTGKVVRTTYLDVNKVAAALRGPSTVKVGLPSGQAPGDLVAIGIYNEFGTRTIPERPFIRNAVRGNDHGIRSVTGKAAAQIMRGEISMQAAMARLGIYFQGKIQAEITALDSPPNAPSTIRQKGSSNPLIDTGRLRSSISWKIED
ncbi:hypothetical protein [Aurantimonas sp. NFXS3]|uniref:hypothetical protein n=1 Tax=Aurantimonas sp. NFXS3 TaxID=2818434 RepID=UPI003B8BD4B8